MRKILVALFALLAATAAAHAWPVHGKQITCPYTAFLTSDGCTGAQAWSGVSSNSILAFQDPDLFSDGTMFQFSSCTGTGTTPAIRRATNSCLGVRNIRHNAAGVDFAVGSNGDTVVYCDKSGSNPFLRCSTTPGATNLIDASAYPWGTVTTGGHDPANTHCSTGSALTNGVVYCFAPAGTVGQTINLVGFDFSPNEGNAGETCMDLLVRGTSNSDGSAGIINFTNNHWKWLNYTACNDALHTVTGSGVTSPSQFNLMNVNSTDNWYVNVQFNSFDGNASKPWVQAAHAYAASGSLPIIKLAGNGKQIVQYNWFRNIPNRPVDTNGACKGIDISYNFIRNLGFYAGQGHFETDLNFLRNATDCNSTITTPFYNNINNVFIEDAGNVLTDMPTGSAPFAINLATGNGATHGFITLLDTELNVSEVNKIGHTGMGSAIPSPAYTSPSGSAVSGDIFTMDAGQGAVCTTYPQWMTNTTSATPTLVQFAGGNCGATAPPNGNYHYSCTGNIANGGAMTACQGTFNATINTTFTNESANYNIWIPGPTFTNATVKNNFVDQTGIAQGIYFSSTCTNIVDVGGGASANYALISGAVSAVNWSTSTGCH